MKANFNNSESITRKQFKMFIAILITGSLLTFAMVVNVHAQTLAMASMADNKDINANETVKKSSFDAGKSALEMNDSKLAIRFFTAAIEENKTNADIFHQRGLAYGRLNQWKNAISDFNSALALDSTQAIYYYHGGLAENKMDKFSLSIADCSKALQLNSFMAEAYLVRGISKAILDDASGSMSDFKSAIANKPDYAEAYYNIGLNYYEEDDNINAKKFLIKAKELGFENKALSFLIK